MGSGRILFLHENESTFVLDDLRILEEKYEVRVMNCSAGTSIARLWTPLREAAASFSWFALGYAARAVLMGNVLHRPSVLVAGGWDVVSFPEIGYGAIRGPRGRLRARVALRGSTRLLTFSEASREAISKLAGRTADLVYLGVDTEKFRPNPAKDDVVVTVGNVTPQNLVRKGIETFVRSARHLPDVPFVVAGALADEAERRLRAIAGPNVELVGRLTQEDLRALLARAKVYVQASVTEGFGLAVAEAMSSGCVPVVTKAGALPEVVGDAGFVVPIGDPEKAAAAIRQALSSGRGASARSRVQEHFPLARRRNRLHEIMEDVLGGVSK